MGLKVFLEFLEFFIMMGVWCYDFSIGKGWVFNMFFLRLVFLIFYRWFNLFKGIDLWLFGRGLDDKVDLDLIFMMYWCFIGLREEIFFNKRRVVSL